MDRSSRSRSRSPVRVREASLERHGRLIEMFARISMVINTMEAVKFLLNQIGNHCDDPSLDDRFSEWSESCTRMMNITTGISEDATRVRRDLLIGLARWGERRLNDNGEMPVRTDVAPSSSSAADPTGATHWRVSTSLNRIIWFCCCFWEWHSSQRSRLGSLSFLSDTVKWFCQS